jgi:hypothetical protein
MNKQLMFLSPIQAKSPHPSGILLTVRRTTEWAGQVQCDEVVDLVETGKGKFGEAIIHSCLTTLFRRLKPQESTTLQLEHDPECRKYDGLLAAMIRAYPGFAENETVTLVFYQPIAWE